MPDNEPPVLVLGFDQYSVLATVRALRAGGFAPWLAVSERGTYAERSRATEGTVVVPDPASDGPGFVERVATTARRLSATAVVPTMETHLFVLADREDRFDDIPTGTPSLDRVLRATDKLVLVELARSAGLQTPPTAEVDLSSETLSRELDLPLIVKPVRGHRINANGSIADRQSVGYLTAPPDERTRAVLADGRWIVQPFIAGDLISVSGVCWSGELVCAVHQKALRIWPEPAGVSSYAETIPRNPMLEESMAHMLRELEWSGIFQAQFIRDRDGELFLIDLNPRVYGSIALAVASGVNLPKIWVDLMIGRTPLVGTYRVGTRFRQEEKDVRAFVRSLREGRYDWQRLRSFLPRRRTTHAVFSIRDPLPLLSSIPKVSQWISDPSFRAARAAGYIE